MHRLSLCSLATANAVNSSSLAGPELASGAAPAANPQRELKDQQVRNLLWYVSSAASACAPPPGPFWRAKDVVYLGGDLFSQTFLWCLSEIDDLAAGNTKSVARGIKHLLRASP